MPMKRDARDPRHLRLFGKAVQGHDVENGFDAEVTLDLETMVRWVSGGATPPEAAPDGRPAA